jgi:transcriptional regulator with XRE-family HTH domain
MKRKSLKQMREAKGLTQEQVAKLTDTTITFISLLENKKRNASDEMKEKLAKIYNCEVTDIYLALRLTDC